MKTLFLAGGTDGIGLAFLELVRADYDKIFVLGREFAKLIEDQKIVKLKCAITGYDEVISKLKLSTRRILRNNKTIKL